MAMHQAPHMADFPGQAWATSNYGVYGVSKSPRTGRAEGTLAAPTHPKPEG